MRGQAFQSATALQRNREDGPLCTRSGVPGVPCPRGRPPASWDEGPASGECRPAAFGLGAFLGQEAELAPLSLGDDVASAGTPLPSPRSAQVQGSSQRTPTPNVHVINDTFSPSGQVIAPGYSWLSRLRISKYSAEENRFAEKGRGGLRTRGGRVLWLWLSSYFCSPH